MGPLLWFEGALFQERGHQIQKNWVLFETFDILHGSDSPDALPPFWNFWATEKAWARITAESRMFLKVQSKFIIERLSNQRCCQWCFSNTLFQKNSTYPWVYFFLRPIRRGNVNFMRDFFSKLRKSRKAALWNKPWKTCTFLCLVGYYILGL